MACVAGPRVSRAHWHRHKAGHPCTHSHLQCTHRRPQTAAGARGARPFLTSLYVGLHCCGSVVDLVAPAAFLGVARWRRAGRGGPPRGGSHGTGLTDSTTTMPAPEPEPEPEMMSAIALAEAADAEAARKAKEFRRPPASVKLLPAPLEATHGMMGERDDSEVPAAAELLIEEAQHLLKQHEYDRALVTLQQGTAVAPRDGSVHLMMALARCKAASAELENIQTLTGPEWGDLALRSRRVEMDIDIYREIRAAQAKRRTTGNQERFNTLLAHARHLAAKTAAEIEEYNSTVDEGLKPFELEAMDELETLVKELRSDEPLEHARAVTRLIGLMLENPRLEAVEKEQAKAKKISDCLKIARMERGLGMHTMVVTLSSRGEQDQWAAAEVICTVMEYDHSTHEAFVSLGGIQTLVVGKSPSQYTSCLRAF